VLAHLQDFAAFKVQIVQVQQMEESIIDLNAFSAEFACVVTAPTNDNVDCVARNGKESIYGVLKEMLPQVLTLCRNDPAEAGNCNLISPPQIIFFE
jgi:hypothetical protein